MTPLFLFLSFLEGQRVSQRRFCNTIHFRATYIDNIGYLDISMDIRGRICVHSYSDSTYIYILFTYVFYIPV
jgi:hypothetical protein